MRTRVLSAEAKVTYFLVAPSFAVGALALTWAALGSLGVALMVVPLQFFVVGFAVRNFRDAEIESVSAPRPWWRMTARPTSGFVVGALFIGQGLQVAVARFSSPDAWALILGATTEVFIGAMFLRSSFRLRTQGLGMSVEPASE